MTFNHEQSKEIFSALHDLNIGMSELLSMAHGHDEIEKVRKTWDQVDRISNVVNDALLGKKVD